MAKISLLVDTDILIDYLKRIKPAREIFSAHSIEIYCSILSKKELLSKPGLSSSDEKDIKRGIVMKLRLTEYIWEKKGEVY